MARREYRQIFSFGNRPDKDAEFVLTVRLNTPPEHEAEFNEWYNIDHVPALVGVPGVYCARPGQPRSAGPTFSSHGSRTDDEMQRMVLEGSQTAASQSARFPPP